MGRLFKFCLDCFCLFLFVSVLVFVGFVRVLFVSLVCWFCLFVVN